MKDSNAVTAGMSSMSSYQTELPALPEPEPDRRSVVNVFRRIACLVVGHKYRVLRRMNPGARKVGCDRCKSTWGMHDATRAFVQWDSEFEAMYAPGGPLDPATYKG